MRNEWLFQSITNLASKYSKITVHTTGTVGKNQNKEHENIPWKKCGSSRQVACIAHANQSSLEKNKNGIFSSLGIYFSNQHNHGTLLYHSHFVHTDILHWKMKHASILFTKFLFMIACSSHAFTPESHHISNSMDVRRYRSHNVLNEANYEDIDFGTPSKRSGRLLEERREEWFNKSVEYYKRVHRLKNVGNEFGDDEEEERFLKLAGLHYFAVWKIRNKQFKHAESIYRRLIENAFEGRQRDGQCNHSSLAITTLLLALHIQRQGSDTETTKKTRAVFLQFFRIVGEDDVKTCACSAKVLQAFALFEMKQGLSKKSYQLVNRAVSMDKELAPVLRWKQFESLNRK